MLFAEVDAPLLRAWIISRLANTSDADADVLADYVLALLRHEGDAESIRKVFDEEIKDFMRDDAVSFADDVFQAVKYRSYVPGAPPAPPLIRAPPQDALLPPRPDLQRPQVPTYPALPTGLAVGNAGSRKRTFNDHDDDDVDIILTSQTPYAGQHPYKQPRRGVGFNARGGRYDDHAGGRQSRAAFNSFPPPGPNRYSAPPLHAPPLPLDPNAILPNSILENIQRLHQLGIPLPPLPELPKPVYSGTTAAPAPRRRRGRCRDYDNKGFCSRGASCLYQHGTESVYIPPLPAAAFEEYDPNNASLPLPSSAAQPLLPPIPPLDASALQVALPPNHRQPKKLKRNTGRPPFAANGPNQDRSKTTLVVQNIPPENFTEDEIRSYFSQFGNIVELSLQGYSRLATLKFDTWQSANAAWNSPKVIFDNRFVKVYWLKDDAESGIAPNGKHVGNSKNGHANGGPSGVEADPSEPELDMEEFKRRQEEAQKAYEEKAKKRKDIERQRQELEDREKELRARQAEAKRNLQKKLASSGLMDRSSSPAEIQTETHPSEQKSGTQTEALRARLAALEEEATRLGVEPDDPASEFSSGWAGRARGRGYRGRGGYPPRAIRGGYGYRGRAGVGVEARHAAYAAFSLDNRPKIVALSGVDFTAPENDEALRQYLMSVGEFTDVQSDASATHVTFKDRKTAEQFMFGVSTKHSIPGTEGKVEAKWATSAPAASGPAGPAAGTVGGDDVPMKNGLEDEKKGKDKADGNAPGTGNAEEGLEDGEIGNAQELDEGDMDYEAGEAQW
ncbi:hypothetical protein GGR56DRAFT_631085 [Xylariaceae sp. FL0804]|nr:hypothetical protein GGR56DRAFT_631085 [Xylariaceae sp. FL0804]